jgi:hypothetical protein
MAVTTHFQGGISTGTILATSISGITSGNIRFHMANTNTGSGVITVPGLTANAVVISNAYAFNQSNAGINLLTTATNLLLYLPKSRSYVIFTTMNTGDRYGKLVILDILPNRRIRCKCDCGKITTVMNYNLPNGHTQSCGCYQKQRASEASLTHGKTDTPEFRTWARMKRRCQNPNHDKYRYYGGRGIKVCDRWQSFENFLEDMGEKPEGAYSLDRIDPNGNYEPSNCRWADHYTQTRNTRRNRFITAHGVTMCMSEWEEKTGIDHRKIHYHVVVKGEDPNTFLPSP